MAMLLGPISSRFLCFRKKPFLPKLFEGDTTDYDGMMNDTGYIFERNSSVKLTSLNIFKMEIQMNLFSFCMMYMYTEAINLNVQIYATTDQS